MLPDELEAIAARHVPGTGKIDIHRLGSGLMNDTYRVQRAGRAYALRVSGSNPYALGLDRAWEARVLERAVLGGLAPVLEYCDPQRGILISRWVAGRSWNPAEVRLQSSLGRMAELARRIHALSMPAQARLMGPGAWIDYYSTAAFSNAAASGNAAGSGNAGGDSTAATLRIAANMRLTALAALPRVAPVVCHSDLHTLNLIESGRTLMLLDWEYAHAADPLWDLAGWSANNDLEDEFRQELLASYTGRPPTPHEKLRLQLLGWLYDYVSLLWCDLYLNLHRDPIQGTVTGRVQSLAARLIATASGRAD
ncbi:MAG TPA: phosphotransferase [Steroidobacteraceae bacterium]|jgi:thiamine kinase-like enzyme|nr:phosphotransferase [Steroidobacteraceae bacterium]